MKETIDIEEKKIGKGQPIFVIAEAGVNHEGSLDKAKALVDAASQAGCDMVKFQTFSADKIVIRKAGMADYQAKNLEEAGHEKQSQYDMLKSLEIGEEMHKELMEYCAKKNIIFQSTPHSNAWSVELLERIGVSSYKIGSGDLTNIPHLKNVALRGKPVILSTGMSFMEEVKEAYHAIETTGNDELVLLHCTTNYPCPIDQVNLKAMKTMAKEFDCACGYSDHTQGLLVPLLAVYNGARVIEKHLTLDRNIENPNSPDHVASMEPDELKQMVTGIRYIQSRKFDSFEQALDGLKSELGIDIANEYAANGFEKTISTVLGSAEKKPNETEIKTMQVARKSIVAIARINKGEKFNEDNVDVLRPLGGMHPREYEVLIENGYAAQDIEPEDFITKDNVEYK